MSDSYATGWMYASSTQLGAPQTTLVTVDRIPRGSTVLVSVALTAVSTGVNLDVRAEGTVVAQILRWVVFRDSDGALVTVDPGPQSFNNSLYIQNCESVTFGLTVELANAYASVNIFIL